MPMPTDQFVVLHKPCKVRVVRAADRKRGYHYAPIGPEGLDLLLEMDFRLREDDTEEWDSLAQWQTFNLAAD